jgi:hypothetical protein
VSLLQVSDSPPEVCSPLKSGPILLLASSCQWGLGGGGGSRDSCGVVMWFEFSEILVGFAMLAFMPMSSVRPLEFCVCLVTCVVACGGGEISGKMLCMWAGFPVPWSVVASSCGRRQHACPPL